MHINAKAIRPHLFCIYRAIRVASAIHCLPAAYVYFPSSTSFFSSYSLPFQELDQTFTSMTRTLFFLVWLIAAIVHLGQAQVG